MAVLPNKLPDLRTLDEEALVIGRIRAGDRKAVATLYQWYGTLIYRRVILPRLPNIELAEDVLKDTFRIALERIHQYEQRGHSIYSWLRRIAINRTIDVHRARGRRQRLLDRIENEPHLIMPTKPPAPDRVPEQSETREMVHRSLDNLNPRYAQALRLRLLEDRDRVDCARALGVSISTFDVILHRACKAFRKAYPP